MQTINRKNKLLIDLINIRNDSLNERKQKENKNYFLQIGQECINNFGTYVENIVLSDPNNFSEISSSHYKITENEVQVNKDTYKKSIIAAIYEMIHECIHAHQHSRKPLNSNFLRKIYFYVSIFCKLSYKSRTPLLLTTIGFLRYGSSFSYIYIGYFISTLVIFYFFLRKKSKKDTRSTINNLKYYILCNTSILLGILGAITLDLNITFFYLSIMIFSFLFILISEYEANSGTIKYIKDTFKLKHSKANNYLWASFSTYCVEIIASTVFISCLLIFPEMSIYSAIKFWFFKTLLITAPFLILFIRSKKKRLEALSDINQKDVLIKLGFNMSDDIEVITAEVD